MFRITNRTNHSNWIFGCDVRNGLKMVLRENSCPKGGKPKFCAI